MDKKHSTQHEKILCDLEFPDFQSQLAKLEILQLELLEKCIRKIQQMTWQQVYQTSSKSRKRGLNWEIIEGQNTRSGKPIASIRVTQKFRARVCRDGVFMRFISLHPDHDSAYK